MNYLLKTFILIGILALVGVGIFLIQRGTIIHRETLKIKTPTKKGEEHGIKLEKELLVKEEKTEKPEITLISVYDNYQVDPALETSWGFSCVIKTSAEQILFDTGGNSEILLYNIKKMNINPQSIDKVVISHIHSDHVGGLEGFLKENAKVTVFIPSSFPDSKREMIRGCGANFVDISSAKEISDFVWITGELYGPPKEQSLIVNSKKGLVVITGCAHPGVVNIIKKTKEIFPEENIYLVLGGFHLGGASDSKLRGIIEDFKKFGVQKVAPCHCSGDKCRELFQQEYKENFIANGVGKIINIE